MGADTQRNQKNDFAQPLCDFKGEERVYSTEIAVQRLAARGIAAAELKRMLCVNTLMRGCVGSYIELYGLSHREPVCIDKLAGNMFAVSDSELPWISDKLCEAEEAKRASNFAAVYEKYIEVADFFESSGDQETAITLHKAGLKGVKLSNDKALEGQAHEQLGATHERLGHCEEAVRSYETFLRVAEAARDAAMKNCANTRLIRAYLLIGAECEETGQYADARDHYTRAVHTAANNGDRDSEAEAYTRLGSITVLLGDLDKALEYQQRFLLVSKQLGGGRKEGRAVRECAVLQERLQQHEEAAASLKRALEIAEEHEDLPAIQSTCAHLGRLYAALEDHAKAVHYYREAFRVAQVLDDPKLIQTCRVNLGMSQGCLRWRSAGGTGYVSIVGKDIQSVLQWKATGSLE